MGDSKVIRMGGTILELSYVGLNHSDSTLVFRLPRERLLFLVDTVPVGAFPGLGMIDFYRSSRRRDEADPGDGMGSHDPRPPRAGRPPRHQERRAGPAQPAARRFRRVKVAAREGKCWNPVESTMKLPKYESWPNYANGLPYVLRRYCGLWGRGT